MRASGALLLGAVAALLVGAAAAPSTSGAFIAKVPTASSGAGTNSAWTCADAVVQDRATALVSYSLDDDAGQSTALDSISGQRNGTWVGSPSKSVARGICYRDTAGFPTVLSGIASRSAPLTYLLTPRLATGSAFTLETWFSTATSTAAGRAEKRGFLFGSGDRDTTAPDPGAVALYLADDGRLVFGVAGGATTVTTRAGTRYDDGYWYHVAATYSPADGASLFVNGRLVGTERPASALPALTTAWRIGYTAPAGWPSRPTDGMFSGSLRFSSIYSSALGPTAIAQHAAAGSGSRPNGDLPAYRG